MSRHTCRVCPWSFERKADLTRHEKKHTGEKPYVCEYCDKGFIQHTALKTHRNTHTKVKPHICGIGTCKKAFGDPSSCTRHRKETHSNGGYKCIVAGCGTKIKRRNAFKTHLRKHGLDPESLDLNATREGNPAMHSTTTDTGSKEDSSHHDEEFRSVSPSSFGNNETLASDFVDNSGCLGDGPLGRRQADLYSASHSLLLEAMFDKPANIGLLARLPDVSPYLSSDFESQPYCNDLAIFPPEVDYSLYTASPLNLPVLEPFPETTSDGSQSSWSSPSSTYSTLYTGFNDDLMSLSLADKTSLPLYNTM